MDPEGPCWGESVDERAERDHELRSALYGIESAAMGLNWHHDRLTAAQLLELTSSMAAEARRLRALLDPQVEQPQAFDLADAIRPVITSARSLGVEVRAAVPQGIEVSGRRHDTAQVVFALLDNARKHAALLPGRHPCHGWCRGDDALRRGRWQQPHRAHPRAIVRARCGRRGGEQGFGPRAVHRPTAHGPAGRVARCALEARRWRIVQAAASLCANEFAPPAPFDPLVARRGGVTRRVLLVEDDALVAIAIQLPLTACGQRVETPEGHTANAVIEHHAFRAAVRREEIAAEAPVPPRTGASRRQGDPTAPRRSGNA